MSTYIKSTEKLAQTFCCCLKRMYFRRTTKLNRFSFLRLGSKLNFFRSWCFSELWKLFPWCSKIKFTKFLSKFYRFLYHSLLFIVISILQGKINKYIVNSLIYIPIILDRQISSYLFSIIIVQISLKRGFLVFSYLKPLK